jgi:hypothetical protein
VITGGVKKATGWLSFFLGAVLSFYISARELGRASSDTGEGWSYLAPGWKLFDPGAHDGHVMLLATVLDAAIYSVVIFVTFYGFVKLVDKLTQ